MIKAKHIIIIPLLICPLINSWAQTNSLMPSAQDPNNCTGLIQKGAEDPPSTTDVDLTTLQTCLTSCDQLYQSSGDPTQNNTMIEGIAYCKNQLSNLYYEMIYKTTYNSLSSTSATSPKGGSPQQQTPNASTEPGGTIRGGAPTKSPEQTPAPSTPAAPGAPATPEKSQDKPKQSKGINWF